VSLNVSLNCAFSGRQEEEKVVAVAAAVAEVVAVEEEENACEAASVTLLPLAVPLETHFTTEVWLSQNQTFCRANSG
jgi:hypothetical protein